MRRIKLAGRYEKDLSQAFRRRAQGLESLDQALGILMRGEKFPNYFRDHALEKRGTNYSGLRECHLDDDLLLIYRPLRDTVVLHRIGTHAELFGGT